MAAWAVTVAMATGAPTAVAQRVRGEVCDSLAAGISLGMDVGGVYGNCAAREDNCDGPGKPRAAAAYRPSLDMVLVYP